MVAWLTRLLLLAQLAVALGLAMLFMHSFSLSMPVAILLAGLAVVGVRLAIILNNFLVAARFRSPLPPECRLTPMQGLRMYLEEARASLVASSWDMPFRRFGCYPAAQRRTLPVLLIHGYGCNSGYWRPLSASLRNAGIGHCTVDLEPVFGSIENYVEAIAEAIDKACGSGGPVVLVGHSMGGLAVRAYLRKYGCGRVAKVVTLGTPHRGTVLARFGIGINTREMAWHPAGPAARCSDWLRRLEQSEQACTRSLFVSIYSHHDNIVSPQTSACLEGAENIGLHGVGHVALASDRRVQVLVMRAIETASPPITDASVGAAN
ncbi:MAG TPA: alpha/beta fold hydrolase [Noviherbaspirillum sp.]